MNTSLRAAASEALRAKSKDKSEVIFFGTDPVN